MATVAKALRALLTGRGFTAVAVLALALGIGANSAIFSLCYAIFLRPLPYAEPERLVQLTSTLAERNLQRVGFSWPRLEALRERRDVFEHVAVAIGTGFTLTGSGDPEQVQGLLVSHELFATLGVQPQLGRDFIAEDDREGAAPVAILSHGLWERRCGARPGALGETLMLEGRAYTVIGVMPRTLARFPLDGVEVFAPRPKSVPFLVPVQIDNGGFFFNVTARLKPGATLAAAQVQASTIAASYAQAYPTHVDAPATIEVVPILDLFTDGERPTFGILIAAVGCVLLIACANVANLVLLRQVGRRKQTAIRYAMGAKRRHVVGELLTENMLLALIGGLAGLALAAVLLAFVRQVGANFITRVDEVAIDPVVIGFTLALALATGAVLSLVAALQVRQPALNDILRDSGRDNVGGRHQNRMRRGFMVAELAVSFVLLVAAALLIASVVKLNQLEPGFEPRGVFVATVLPPAERYPQGSPALVSFYRRLYDELQSIPGATKESLHTTPPLSGFAGPLPYAVVGRPIPSLREQALALRQMVAPGAFDLLGIPFVHGRDFDLRDTPDSTPAVIINETMAKQAFPNEDPIGKRIVSGMVQLTQEVVGVIADTTTQALDQAPQAEMYYPMLQRPENFITVLVHSDGDPNLMAAPVRAALKAVDPNVPLTNLTNLEAIAADSMGDRRLAM
jgi:predicted permease